MDHLTSNNLTNHNALNQRQGTECGTHDGVPSIFDAVQFFLYGLKPLPLWELQPQDVLQEEISMLIPSPKK